MNRPLSRRESLAHLDAIIAGISAEPGKDLVFLDRLKKLRAIVEASDREEITLDAVHRALFDGLKPESRRTTFSAFRTALTSSADKFGRSFALVQPHGRGKAANQIPLHFEGSAISLQRDLDDTAARAVAGRDRETLIQAPAAFVTGEFYERLLLHFTDPQTSARLPVRFFLSYAHKNSKLKDKLLDALRDELAISRRFDFSIWEDKGILIGNEWHREIQTALAECDLCLSLLSPAFLASTYIVEHEIPPIVAREIPSIPVELEPLDLKRHNTRGLEDLQIFTPAFSNCSSTAAQKDFARNLAHKIEEKVAEEALAIAQRFAADYLSGKREARDLADHHPELVGILSEGVPTSAVPSANNSSPCEAPAKPRINSLLTGCLKSLPSHLITPYAATGDLESVTREIARQSANDDAPDPYLIFQRHQRSAVDYLAFWAQDPTGAPFAAVLGEIGSGKTTTLQMLAQRLSKDPAAPPIIFIDLREYFDPAPPTLEGILADHLRRYDPEKRLTVDELIDAVRTQRGVIVFDGLDEKIISLAEAARQNFIRELWRVLPPEIMDKPANSGRGKLVISCRSHYFPSVQAIRSGFVGSDRAKVTTRDYLACVMLPWKDGQIRKYLSQVVGEEHLASAIDLIETVHNLKDLASRPYLISLIGQELEELKLERAAGRVVNAASLYRKFIELWLHRDEGKHVFTPAHKLRLMESIAAALWKDNARTWPWERVEEWLETFLYENPTISSALSRHPISILQQDFRTATFFLRPDSCADSFRFAHTSFQEYFLARYFARSLENHISSNWNIPKPSLETFCFLDQHLQSLKPSVRDKAFEGLQRLLAESEIAQNAKLNGICYYLHAFHKGLPVPEKPKLNARDLNLEGWEFRGDSTKCLVFGDSDFSGADLHRAIFEHVLFSSSANFFRANLKSTSFYQCTLLASDFRQCLLNGSFFRECNLYRSQTDSVSFSNRPITHLSPGSPWHQTTLTCPPSASYAHGHSSFVNSVSFSPDGSLIISGSTDHTVRIWDALSGICIQTLYGHTGPVTSNAFLPDGIRAISASSDQTLRIWNTKSGECIRVLEGHTGSINLAAFLDNCATIASVSNDRTIRFWDSSTGFCNRSLRIDASTISAAFSMNGNILVSTVGGYLHVLDRSTGTRIRTLSGHKHEVISAVFSPNNSVAASTSSDCTIRIWDVSTGACLKTLQGHTGPVNSSAFSSDGSLIASASSDQTVRVWDYASGVCIYTLRGHSDSVNSVSFSPDGQFIVSASRDKRVIIWDTSSGSCIRMLSEHSIQASSFSGMYPHLYESNHSVTELGNSIYCIGGSNSIIREILLLPRGQSITREPWDEVEARKPYHEIRWKFTYGPKDAWRWCHVVDPETGAIHPPELAAVPGAFSGPEVGPV